VMTLLCCPGAPGWIIGTCPTALYVKSAAATTHPILKVSEKTCKSCGALIANSL